MITLQSLCFVPFDGIFSVLGVRFLAGKEIRLSGFQTVLRTRIFHDMSLFLKIILFKE